MRIFIIILFLIQSTSSFATRTRMASKDFIINHLKNIFLQNGIGDEQFSHISTRHFNKHKSFFGEACDPYQVTFIHERDIPSGATTEYFSPVEKDKLCQSVIDISTRAKFAPSPERLSVIISACHELIFENEIYMENINLKICEKKSCKFSANYIQKSYSLFHPFNNLKDEDSDYLFNLFKDNEESHQNIVFSLCIDPNWQSN